MKVTGDKSNIYGMTMNFFGTGKGLKYITYKVGRR